VRRSIERCHEPGRKYQRHPVHVQVKAEELNRLRKLSNAAMIARMKLQDGDYCAALNGLIEAGA